MFSTVKKSAIVVAMASAAVLSLNAQAAEYVIDTEGAHASVNFKASHLGYSFIIGRFDKFEGTFNYDKENVANNSATVTIDTSSVNSGHAERDKHLRSADFLNTGKFKEAKFVSTEFKQTENDEGLLTGNLTLNGVTKPVVLEVEMIGAGSDPWGGERAGFEAEGEISMKEFGINHKFGDQADKVKLEIIVEGIKK